MGEVNEETYLRKGLDRFINIAKKMPTIQFIHIGKWTDNHGRVSSEMIEYVKSISPANIHYLGYVKNKELKKHYEESKIYLQLSRHEAFGVSVVEAMRYGCTPVVSNVFALPEVVGNNGFVINNIGEAINAIILAMLDKHHKLKNNLLEKFWMDKRLQKFKRIIEN